MLGPGGRGPRAGRMWKLGCRPGPVAWVFRLGTLRRSPVQAQSPPIWAVVKAVGLVPSESVRGPAACRAHGLASWSGPWRAVASANPYPSPGRTGAKSYSAASAHGLRPGWRPSVQPPGRPGFRSDPFTRRSLAVPVTPCKAVRGPRPETAATCSSSSCSVCRHTGPG